jgi:hypothetical protein
MDERDLVLHGLAKAVADRLGDQWAYVPEKQGIAWATITAKDGRGLHFAYVRGDSKRLRISTCGWPPYAEEDGQHCQFYPHQLEGRPASPSITVAMARGGEAIMSEIAKRLLPEYGRLWTLCAREAASHQAYWQRKLANWTAMCKRLGCDPSRNRAYPNGISMSILNSGDTSVSIERLDVTHEQALAIVALLGGQVKGA